MRLRSGEWHDLWRCPRHYQRGEPARWLRLHSHWSAGRYWHGANIGEWPARDLRALEIIDAEVADHQRAIADRGAPVRQQ